MLCDDPPNSNLSLGTRLSQFCFFHYLKNFFICFGDGWFLLAAVIVTSPLAPRRFRSQDFTEFSRYWSVIKYTYCAWLLVMRFNIKSDISPNVFKPGGNCWIKHIPLNITAPPSTGVGSCTVSILGSRIFCNFYSNLLHQANQIQLLFSKSTRR